MASPSPTSTSSNFEPPGPEWTLATDTVKQRLAEDTGCVGDTGSDEEILLDEVLEEYAKLWTYKDVLFIYVDGEGQVMFDAKERSTLVENIKNWLEKAREGRS